MIWTRFGTNIQDILNTHFMTIYYPVFDALIQNDIYERKKSDGSKLCLQTIKYNLKSLLLHDENIQVISYYDFLQKKRKANKYQNDI